MARIRSIKPEFWTSEQIMSLKPVTRLLFIGMWNFADDYGRMPFAPGTIKAQVLPSDPFSIADVRDMVVELSAAGLVLLYSVEGRDYIEITGWSHQKIDKPHKPKFPGAFSEGATVLSEPSPNVPRTLSVGEDRIGKDGGADAHRPVKKDRRRATQYPEGFSPDFAKATSAGLSRAEAEREALKFKNHAVERGRTCIDWQAAWHNWCLKAAEFMGRKPQEARATGPVVPNDFAVKLYRESGRWNVAYGPEPDKPGCLAPPEILEKYGYRNAA